jgi:D-alanyl-lipoteichoic acid acyltransferase DltB (MBOAT superfamily)
VGISFYTFENLSYTIDIYDRKFKPVKKFIDYLFFLSFFPKLMMGPIVRAADFVPQIYKKININDEKIGIGLYLITSGIIKKIVISDYINENFVKYIFSNPSSHTGLECLLAVYGYALVIYCDFSGYSDMAIGIAKWIGFDININFLSPYQSSSITEFWRKWHISLSSWLKDYLYIRWLGGNKKGGIKTNLNLLATMLLGGFWHGASWNFIFWGGLHGIGLIIDKTRIRKFKKLNVTNSLSILLLKFLGILITFNFVCLCWIFFRCETFQNSWVMINKIFTEPHFENAIPLFNNYTNIFIIIFLGFGLHSIPIKFENSYKEIIIKLPIPLKILYLFICIFIAIQFKQAHSIKPIYLQF